MKELIIMGQLLRPKNAPITERVVQIHDSIRRCQQRLTMIDYAREHDQIRRELEGLRRQRKAIELLLLKPRYFRERRQYREALRVIQANPSQGTMIGAIAQAKADALNQIIAIESFMLETSPA